MVIRWGNILLLTLVAATGCTSAKYQQCLEAEREWHALCRAMESAPAKSSSAALPDSVTSQALYEAARRASSAVVWVATVHHSPDPTAPVSSARAQTSGSVGGGSGVWIAPGIVLTNEHVIHDASSVVVQLADRRRYRVERIAVAAGHDLAVLRVACQTCTPLSLDGKPAGEGTGVAAVGGPHFPPAAQCRIGIVEQCTTCLQKELDPQGRRDYSKLLQTTAQVQPGFSGGPLLDQDGNVVGISVASSGRGNSGRGYAIPLTDAVRATIDDLCRQVRAQ